MSTNMADLQGIATALEQVGVAAAGPFIHSTSGQATESKVLGEVNLGIQLIPAIESLISLLHKIHDSNQARKQTTAAQPVTPVGSGAV